MNLYNDFNSMFDIYFFFIMDDCDIHLRSLQRLSFLDSDLFIIRIVAYLHPKGLKVYMVMYTAFMLPILQEAASSDLHIILNIS